MCGVRRRRTAQSFGDFLADLTSQCAHLMPFQLPPPARQPSARGRVELQLGGEVLRREAPRGARACRSQTPASSRELSAPQLCLKPEDRSPHTLSWWGEGRRERGQTFCLLVWGAMPSSLPALSHPHFLRASSLKNGLRTED